MVCKEELAGRGLKPLWEKLGVPQVFNDDTCTDTGRIADLIGGVYGAMGEVPVPDLPGVAAAPQYMEQKATIDPILVLAFGLYTSVNPVPNFTGGQDLCLPR